MQKYILVTILCFLSQPLYADVVYNCAEPQGYSMSSVNNQKMVKDGFTGVYPKVFLGEKTLKIVWGDTKTLGGNAEDWIFTPHITHNDQESISGVSQDAGAHGVIHNLYTFDKVRKYLYFTRTRVMSILPFSSASVFVTKCK
jgi:hypothetical protein